jgi:hypothetical protein
MEIKEYLVQVYDDKGHPCKFPRYFKGTEEEVKQYVRDRFGLVDACFGRTTRYYETTNEEDIPQEILLQK